MKDVDKDVEKNAFGDKDTRELLRLSTILYHWPEILSEYDRLSQEQKRLQKESHPRSKQDPLAEFEHLFLLWERTQNRIKQQTYPHKKERKFVIKAKTLFADYMRQLEYEDMKNRDSNARIASQVSPSPTKE